MIKTSSSPAISIGGFASVSVDLDDLTRIEVPRIVELDLEMLSSGDVHLIESNDDPGAPVADPLLGKVVADRYRVLEAIGRGGMGVVYKVAHARIGKLLAMKLLTGELSQSPAIVRRFKREALAVSKLGSPNTVQVFDFGASDGLTYLVMELVDGDSLGHVLRAGGPMPLPRLGKIVVQVCSALAEAHRHGIVHRDIKPENVMLIEAEGGADLVKVLDFGLAKLREAEGLCDITGQGTILGTPHYMAPEQIRGDEVDARTDVYAVGALMYRALTGHHPFSGPPMSVLARHLHEIPIPPAERAPELGIPPRVSDIVMRALAKRPADRFQRIEDLQQAVIDEVRAAGSSSVEGLLDWARLRRLSLGPRSVRGEHDRAAALATRDEVDAYERRLRRTRFGAAGIGAALLASAAIAASLFVPRDQPFAGVEMEPNDTPAEATPIPLGQTVRGHIGRRLDALHGDRDFYAFDLPARAPGERAFLRLRVGALPNLPMCTMLYRPGFADAVGQYCVGRTGKDLVIPTLELDPGRYLVAVLQDVAPYGGSPPHVHENISDTYALLAESTTPEPGTEIEPNDTPASATPLSLGQPCTAAIGWARDEDVFCVADAVTGPIRWKVRSSARDGSVLEATLLQAGIAGAPVRIHLDDDLHPGEGEAVSPWRSEAVVDDASPRCLRVRMRGAGASEAYAVEAEAVSRSGI